MSNNQWNPNFNSHWNQPSPLGELPVPAPIPLDHAPDAVLGDPRLQDTEQSTLLSQNALQIKKELQRLEQEARHRERSRESQKAPIVRVKPEPVEEDSDLFVVAQVKGEGYEAACKASEESKLRKRARYIKEGQKKRRGDIEEWKQESLTDIAKERAEAELEREAAEVARIVREAETKKALEELQKKIDGELVAEKMLELKRLKQSNALRQEELERNAPSAQIPAAQSPNSNGTGSSSSSRPAPSRRGRPRKVNQPVASRTSTRVQAAKQKSARQ